MKLLGITAEYNPFHSGHKYHIEKSVSDLNPDAVVVVMSGNFTQRGSVACFDKWTRAKCALLNGADLVIELPVTFATASAERFAYGSIYLLDKMNVKHISFGTENNLQELNKIASDLMSENFEINLPPSVPFHIARQSALKEGKIIAKPNNILAIEYLKALNKLNSNILPHGIMRFGAGYHDTNIINDIASATKVRELMGENCDYSSVVPDNLLDIYKNASFICEDSFYSQLIYSIISKSPSKLNKYAHIREGIENRIYKCAFESKSYDDLVKNIKSKRYTYTAISRMLISILLGIKKEDLNENPLYLRVLGLNNKGAKALGYIESVCDLPIVTKTSAAYNTLSPDAIKSLELDIKASDIYYSLNLFANTGRPDFVNSPIKI